MNHKILAMRDDGICFGSLPWHYGAAEKAEGKAAPTITASFASSEITPGQPGRFT